MHPSGSSLSLDCIAAAREPLPHEPVSYRLCTGAFSGRWFRAHAITRLAARYLGDSYGWDRVEVRLASGGLVVVKPKVTP